METPAKQKKQQKQNKEYRIENRESAYAQTTKFQLNPKKPQIWLKPPAADHLPRFSVFRFSPRLSTTETDIDREIIKIDIPTWLLQKQLASTHLALPVANCYDPTCTTSYCYYSSYSYYYSYFDSFCSLAGTARKGGQTKIFHQTRSRQFHRVCIRTPSA